MIGLPAGTPIWLAAGITDMRSGFNSLAAKVDSALAEDPFSGNVFVFRGRRRDTIKLLWWTGDGMCLLAKRLERGRHIWPNASSGTVNLTQTQMEAFRETEALINPVLRSYRAPQRPAAQVGTVVAKPCGRRSLHDHGAQGRHRLDIETCTGVREQHRSGAGQIRPEIIWAVVNSNPAHVLAAVRAQPLPALAFPPARLCRVGLDACQSDEPMPYVFREVHRQLGHVADVLAPVGRNHNFDTRMIAQHSRKSGHMEKQIFGCAGDIVHNAVEVEKDNHGCQPLERA